jgi:short-subunit dehydrogenase
VKIRSLELTTQPQEKPLTESERKAAAWSLTNGLRNELRSQGTQVLGLRVGFVDTDLARGLDVVKVSPQSVAISAFDALEAGASEVLADERAWMVKRGLTAEPAIYL